MRGIWIRRLLPASALAIVLALSYFAPALGFLAPPVNSAKHTNCGRFGYGYHGGKHDFFCPKPRPEPPRGAAPTARPLPSPVGAHGSAAIQPASAPRTKNAPAAAQAPRVVVDASVTDGADEWRAFVRLLRTELSAGG